jgi:Uma2 family endonuclease
MARAKGIDDGDYLTPEAYLAAEEQTSVRHEYIDGFVFAMAGARERHNVIKLALASLLENHIEEPCRVFDGDMKLRTVRGKSVRFYYPDIFVSCGEADDEQVYRGDAIVAIEVLSQSTERQRIGRRSLSAISS